MNWQWIIYVGCALVIFTICTFLVLHNHYEDGIVGRVALCIIATAEFMVLLETVIDGYTYQLRPTTVATQLGMMLFLSRHLYRFLRKCYSRSFTWREIQK